MEYLSLPLTLRKGRFKKTDLYNSISNSIGLILSTRPGSIPFDPEFGCELWSKEFSDFYTANRSDIQGGIRKAIGKYEKRLINVSVTLQNVETAPGHPLGIAVKVIGNYQDGDSKKRFEELFRVG
jgi:phage baseplate assembly protein W